MNGPNPRSLRLSAALLLTAACAAAPVAAQCTLVADLTPGPGSTRFGQPVAAFGEQLYFTWNSPTLGIELWKWDPQNGVGNVADIHVGTGNSRPDSLTPCCTALGPLLFFAAFDIGRGFELYATNGSAGGTYKVKEIRPGSGSSLPTNMAASDGRVFFSAHDGSHGNELWVSDGTGAGTTLLRDIHPGRPRRHRAR